MEKIEFFISEPAKARVIMEMNKRGKGKGIRVGIKTTGCSGLAYTLEYADDLRDHDLAFSVDDNYAIYLDPKAAPYLKGSTMDYVKKGLNEGFDFINPNEKGRCGCGESFTA